MDEIFNRRPRQDPAPVPTAKAANRAVRKTGARKSISRLPVVLARGVPLAGFVLTVFAGLFGSVGGSHNFAIIFVWIAWWTALKLLFIPLGGRSWCSMCPIPLPGERLQRGGALEQ